MHIVQPNRFDYVKYDDTAYNAQADFKSMFVTLEAELERHFGVPKSAGVARYKAMAISQLELAYAMVGKVIRDDQIARDGGAQLQEGRNVG